MLTPLATYCRAAAGRHSARAALRTCAAVMTTLGAMREPVQKGKAEPLERRLATHLYRPGGAGWPDKMAVCTWLRLRLQWQEPHN